MSNHQLTDDLLGDFFHSAVDRECNSFLFLADEQKLAVKNVEKTENEVARFHKSLSFVQFHQIWHGQGCIVVKQMKLFQLTMVV